jgi:RNA ligase
VLIKHIDDVRPHIEGRKDFIIGEKDGYTVIDYVMCMPDSFENPIRLECRGLKFGEDGRLIARPLHKFFNINERETTQESVIDFSRPHIITEKLDGSMIHPCIVKDEVVFMTRMGRTDVAKAAEKIFLSPLLKQKLSFIAEIYTPIFEYTGPQNRIILRYEEPQMTLLAVREIESGVYLPRSDVTRIAEYLGFPAISVCSMHGETLDSRAFLEYVRTIKNQEGFIFWFPESNLWFKAKGDDYVLKHRAKAAIELEKNVLALILRGELDDVLPLLDKEYRAKVELYRARVLGGLMGTVQKVDALLYTGKKLDRKTFATEHMKDVPKFLQTICFSALSGKPVEDALITLLLKNVNSQTAVDGVRKWIGNPKWQL